MTGQAVVIAFALCFFIHNCFAVVCDSTFNAFNLNSISELGCTNITGSVVIQNTNLTNLDLMENVTSIGGYLAIWENDALNQIDGLSSLTYVGGYLSIDSNSILTQLDGLSSLTSVGLSLDITSNDALTQIDGLSSVTSVVGYLRFFSNSALTQLNGLSSLTYVGGLIAIQSNSVLSQIDGILNLTYVGSFILIDPIPICSLQIIDLFWTQFSHNLTCNSFSCLENSFGENCSNCECVESQGICDDGINGTGICTCENGFNGNKCQFEESSTGDLIVTTTGHSTEETNNEISIITEEITNEISTSVEKITETTGENSQEIEKDVSDTFAFNGNVLISRNITISGDMDIGGDLDIFSSTITLRNNVRVNGTLRFDQSTLVFSDPSKILTATCVQFTEQSSIKTNFSAQDKETYTESNPLVLIRSECMDGEEFIIDKESSCDEQGFTEKYQYDDSELSVLFTACSNKKDFTVIAIVSIIVIVLLLVISVVLFLTVPSLRNLLAPFRKRKRNPNNKLVNTKLAEMDKEIANASKRVKNLQIELSELDT